MKLSMLRTICSLVWVSTVLFPTYSIFAQVSTPIPIYTRVAALSPDGAKLATGDSAGMLRIWDHTLNTLILAIQANEGMLASLAWSPDGRQIATGGADEAVRIWDVQTGRFIRALIDHGQGVASIAWSDNGKYIYTGTTNADYSPMLRKWDATTGAEIASVRQVAGSLELSPGGNLIFAGTGIATLAFDSTTLEIVAVYTRPDDHDNNYQAISRSIAPDGSSVAVGYLNGWVRIWDVESQEVIAQFAAHDGHPPCCRRDNEAVDAVYFDGEHLTTVTLDGTFRLWNVSTQELLLNTKTKPAAQQIRHFSDYGAQLIANGFGPLSSAALASDVDVFVPAPSLTRLSIVAHHCISAEGQRGVTFATDNSQLPDFVSQLGTLTDAQIPAGCRADLLAIVSVLRGE